MLRRIWISIFVVSLLFLSMVGMGFAARVYDNFNGTGIDHNKWQEGTIYRKIDVGNNRLLFKTASPAPIMMTSFPYSYSNSLGFSNPDSITSMQADVAVLESNITGTARAVTTIGGRFYNDGTGTGSGDLTGDIWAEVTLRRRGAGLEAYYYIGRYTTPNDTSTTQLAFSYFTATIDPGTAYTLYVGYNSSINQFTFKVGAETKTVSSPAIPAYNRSPSVPLKLLMARVWTYNITETGSITSTYTNVYKNEALYDSFSSPTLDTSKWGNSYEFQREVTNGRLYSLVKASAQDAGTSLTFPFQFSPGLSLNWDNPITDTIKFAAATVTPLSYQSANDAIVGARISSEVYNDGSSSGTSWLGDVNAAVGLFVVENELKGRWLVNRNTEDSGNPCTFENLAQGLFTATINLGTPYHLFLGFDGTTITFRLNDEVATYTPTTPTNPAHNDYGNVGGRVVLCNATQSGSIEAESDNVLINDPSSIDFDLDAKTDIAAYHTPSGLWFIKPSSGAADYYVGYGGTGYIPVPGDFDGDGKTDVAVCHSTSGLWFIKPSSGAADYYVGYGGTGYVPVPGDYDGDGKTDVAIYHQASGLWYVKKSSDGYSFNVTYGGSGFDPVLGDFDGDGKTDFVIYHQTSGLWYVMQSSNYGSYNVTYGGSGYAPVPGDYDGDGKTDIAVYHSASGLWFIKPSSGAADYYVGYGGTGYYPVPGDFDGDGKTDIAVYHSASGLWFIKPSSGAADYYVAYGGSGYVPVNLDYLHGYVY